MAIIGHHERLTADASGDATMTIENNGLVSLVFVSPVGAVDAGSTAALQEVFSSADGDVTRTVVAAEACNVDLDLWDQPVDGSFSIAKNRDLQVVIASAAEGDEFDVWVDVISDAY